MISEYSNTQISKVIADYIHNQRDRDVLLRRYIDGITFERLGEEFGMSTRQIKNIVYKHEGTIFKHL